MAEWAFLNPSPPDLPPPLLLRPQGLRAPPAGRPVAQDRLSHGPAHGWGSARTERAAGVAPVAPPRHPRRGCQRANNGVDPKGATDRLRCPGMTPTHASPPSSAPAPRPPPARRIAYPTTGACSRRTRQGTHEPQGAASLNLLRSRQTPARQRRARRGRHRCHAPQRPQRALRCRAEGSMEVARVCACQDVGFWCRAKLSALGLFGLLCQATDKNIGQLRPQYRNMQYMPNGLRYRHCHI